MRAYGTNIVAGVSRSGGGVDDVLVYPTCAEAVAATGAVASVAMVSPLAVAAAVEEAVAAGIRLIITVAEGMPVADAVRTRRLVQSAGACWIGASTPGVAIPGRCKLGFLPDVALSPGRLGVMSKSGTLSYEVCYRLASRGLGQSLWVGVGGDAVKGTRFCDLLPVFAADANTAAVVVIGEIGGIGGRGTCRRHPGVKIRQAGVRPRGRPHRSGRIDHGPCRRLGARQRRHLRIQTRGTHCGRRRRIRPHPGSGRCGRRGVGIVPRRPSLMVKLTEEQRRMVASVRALAQAEFKPRADQMAGRHVSVGEHARARRPRRARHGGAGGIWRPRRHRARHRAGARGDRQGLLRHRHGGARRGRGADADHRDLCARTYQARRSCPASAPAPICWRSA